MAPKKPESGTRSNRIRFVMLDADISDGNLSELTEAITIALRPSSSAPIRQLPSQTPLPAILPAETPVLVEEADEVAGAAVEDTGDGTASAPKTKAKLPLPNYIHDLDLKGNGGPSFKEYAAQKAPTSHARRYLVAALV
jgi:hypothetical protein